MTETEKKFPFIFRGKKFQHRSARGSTLRYKLDELCADFTIEELKVLLKNYDERAKNEEDEQQVREFRTCCKIIRDWIKIKKVANGYYTDAFWDTGKGALIGEKIFTVELSEDEKEIVIRDEEGIIVDRQRWEK